MEKFEEGNYYHIYNRGANRGNIFFAHNDYEEFLKRFFYYLYPSVQTLCWCLMSNHFHALIRVRTLSEQIILYENFIDSFVSDRFHGKLSPETKPFNVSRQLAHFMNSYTRFFNQKLSRKGTLVEGPLKRIKITDDNHLTHLVCYIHRNPIHHGLVRNYMDYFYSSNSEFISERKSFVEKRDVIDRFGGVQNFVHAHDEFRLKIEMTLRNGLYLE